jgi:hypothetical protein
MTTIFEKFLLDGRQVHVNLLTFSRARLSIGKQGSGWYDDEW